MEWGDTRLQGGGRAMWEKMKSRMEVTDLRKACLYRSSKKNSKEFSFQWFHHVDRRYVDVYNNNRIVKIIVHGI